MLNSIPWLASAAWADELAWRLSLNFGAWIFMKLVGLALVAAPAGLLVGRPLAGLLTGPPLMLGGWLVLDAYALTGGGYMPRMTCSLLGGMPEAAALAVCGFGYFGGVPWLLVLVATAMVAVGAGIAAAALMVLGEPLWKRLAEAAAAPPRRADIPARTRANIREWAALFAPRRVLVLSARDLAPFGLETPPFAVMAEIRPSGAGGLEAVRPEDVRTAAAPADLAEFLAGAVCCAFDAESVALLDDGLRKAWLAPMPKGRVMLIADFAAALGAEPSSDLVVVGTQGRLGLHLPEDKALLTPEMALRWAAEIVSWGLTHGAARAALRDL